jgi:hypothetical protein
MSKEEIVTTLDEINEDLKAGRGAGDAGGETDLPDVDLGYEAASAKAADTKAKKGKKESDIEIEVVDDTPPEDQGRKPLKTAPKETDEIDAVNEKVQKRLDELKRAWHDERRAKERAAREHQAALDYAKKIIEENRSLKVQLSRGEKVLVEQGTGKAEADLKSAKRALQEAQEAGDAEKVAEAVAQISRITREQDQWKMYQPRYREEDVPKTDPLQELNTGVTYSQADQNAAPPPDEKAISWYNRNTWFGVDEEMTALAYAQHERLVKGGVSPQSDEYYERIDARLRQVFPDRFESDSSEPEPPKVEKRQQTTVVAPATRSTPSKKVTLTKSQVAIARRLGVPLEVYAKQVAMQENR